MGCSKGTRLAAGDGAGEPGTEAEPTDVDEPLVDSYTKAAGSLIDAGEEAADPAAGDDEGRTECAASEGAKPRRRREARDAAGGGEPEDDEEVVVELLTWRTCRAGVHARAAAESPAWSTWHHRTVSSDEGSGDHVIDHKDDAYDEGGDPGSSESSSQSEEEEAVGRVFGNPLEDDNDDEAEMSDDDGDEVVKQKTSSSTPSPLPSKAHRRTERSVPVTGTLLPPPRRPWKEHGKDFGLLVPEDRWSKHVAAKRREAQLIRRNLQDQLRMKALQWRQKENHFHRRYKPAIPAGTI
nr:uncharacterized protein LOC119168632 [Rhipicephalus microplus]